MPIVKKVIDLVGIGGDKSLGREVSLGVFIENALFEALDQGAGKAEGIVDSFVLHFVLI